MLSSVMSLRIVFEQHLKDLTKERDDLQREMGEKEKEIEDMRHECEERLRIKEEAMQQTISEKENATAKIIADKEILCIERVEQMRKERDEANRERNKLKDESFKVQQIME